MANIGDKKVHCTKIAMVYTKQLNRFQQAFGSPTSRKNVAGQFGSPNENDIRQRNMSHNFMHEQRLLDALDMIAVIPVP